MPAAEVERWTAERRERYGDNDRGELLPERKPDEVKRVLSRLKAIGLPVEGVGIPGRAASPCPLCSAGLCVEFHQRGFALTCVAGCAEADVVAAIAKGRRR